MATILNPTPVTASTFGAMWITNVNINLPTTAHPSGFLTAALKPFDGQNILANGGKFVRITDIPAKIAADSTFATFLAGLIAETKRVSGKTVEPQMIAVMAGDATKPVVGYIRFADGSAHAIPNCFTLAGTDSTFAGVLMGLIAEIGRLAELTVA